MTVRKAIEHAVQLGKSTGHVLVATSDPRGLPHLAASGKITLEGNGLVGVSEWFCPGTLANLQVNPRISVVVWDPKTDKGFQLPGDCDKVEDISMMDGFIPKGAHENPFCRLSESAWSGWQGSSISAMRHTAMRKSIDCFVTHILERRN